MRVICPSCLSVNNVPQKESYKKANCGKCKNSLLDTTPIELNERNFDEIVINSDLPVIIDFWAPWCGPCKMMTPTFKKIASKFPLKMIFAKVNTENEENLGQRFEIRSIPTLIVFKNGKEVERVSGTLDEGALTQLVARFI